MNAREFYNKRTQEDGLIGSVQLMEEYASQSKWVSVEDRLPENEEAVLLSVLDGKKQKTVRAVYVKKYTMSEGEFHGDMDYCDDDDTFYWPEGWYEWNEYDEIHWRVSDTPVSWQPLPKAPKQ